MGYIVHHAIVVTTYDDQISVLREKAVEIFEANDPRADGWIARVSPVVESGVNGYGSFLVAPDGSKSGWGHSDAGDEARDKLVAILREAGVDFVEIVYGGDSTYDHPPRIERAVMTSTGDE